MFGHVGAFKSIKIQKMPKCMCHWRCQLGDLGIGSFEPNLPLVSNKHVSRCISDSSVRTFYEEVEEKISKFVGFVMVFGEVSDGSAKTMEGSWHPPFLDRSLNRV